MVYDVPPTERVTLWLAAFTPVIVPVTEVTAPFVPTPAQAVNRMSSTRLAAVNMILRNRCDFIFVFPFGFVPAFSGIGIKTQTTFPVSEEEIRVLGSIYHQQQLYPNLFRESMYLSTARL